jgi:type II secretory pathway pseudopilin PulG
MEIIKEFGLSFLQLFLGYVLPPLAAAIAALVISWLTKKINEATARLGENAQWAINQAVRAAVLAAEQVHLVDTAINKKEYALDKATEWLALKGIKFDLSTLDTLIEAAVMQEFNLSKAVKK